MIGPSRYQITRTIKRGGMAEVLEAYVQGDEGFRRRVAIKRVLPELADESFIRSFVDEARIVSQLHHANIVSVFDFGVVDDLPFQVLEFVDGDDMAALLERAREAGTQLPVELALHVVAEVATALEYAHTAMDANGQGLGIVHRDVSPANILISWAGDVKLADFGIAFSLGKREATRVGIAKGKLEYMAPEQARGEDLDGRTDIFALGLVLHELVTGKKPLEDDDVRRGVFAGDPLPIAPEVPDDVAQIIARATRTSRRDRHPGAGHVAAEAGRALSRRSSGHARTDLREWVTPLRPAATAGHSGHSGHLQGGHGGHAPHGSGQSGQRAHPLGDLMDVALVLKGGGGGVRRFESTIAPRGTQSSLGSMPQTDAAPVPFGFREDSSRSSQNSGSGGARTTRAPIPDVRAIASSLGGAPLGVSMSTGTGPVQSAHSPLHGPPVGFVVQAALPTPVTGPNPLPDGADRGSPRASGESQRSSKRSSPNALTMTVEPDKVSRSPPAAPSPASPSASGTSPSDDPLIGTAVEEYQILELLGSGAFARVYRARHLVLGGECAIKVLGARAAGDQRFGKRLRREAEALRHLHHTNVVRVLDAGSTPSGSPFVAMEILRGKNLRDLIRRSAPFPPERSAAITWQIASGLEAAHRHGFVHRDLKPANIMLVSDRDGGETAKILDFGLALVLDADVGGTRFTMANELLGTPKYMAPEQILSAADVGPSADLYALGVIFHEMLAGTPPFQGGISEVTEKHLYEQPPRLPPMRGLEDLVFRLLEKEPKDRPATAQALLDELDRLGFRPADDGAEETHAGEIRTEPQAMDPQQSPTTINGPGASGSHAGAHSHGSAAGSSRGQPSGRGMTGAAAALANGAGVGSGAGASRGGASMAAGMSYGAPGGPGLTGTVAPFGPGSGPLISAASSLIPAGVDPASLLPHPSVVVARGPSFAAKVGWIVLAVVGASVVSTVATYIAMSGMREPREPPVQIAPAAPPSVAPAGAAPVGAVASESASVVATAQPPPRPAPPPPPPPVESARPRREAPAAPAKSAASPSPELMGRLARELTSAGLTLTDLEENEPGRTHARSWRDALARGDGAGAERAFDALLPEVNRVAGDPAFVKRRLKRVEELLRESVRVLPQSEYDALENRFLDAQSKQGAGGKVARDLAAIERDIGAARRRAGPRP